MNIIPTVGRMVYYKSYGSIGGKFPSKDRAAVITDVQDRRDYETVPGDENTVQVRLCVMNPEGLFFTGWIEQGQEGGQWDWMPFQKDQAARMAPGILNASHAPEAGLVSPK